MKKTALATALSLCVTAPAMATGFVNGDFETGDTTGWTTGAGYRGSVLNNALNPAAFLPGGSLYNASIDIGGANPHSAVVSAGTAPHTDGNLRQVYSGNHSFRAEDTTWGGYASVITQTVTGYTDPDIFFAWAAVLQGAHGTNDAATFLLVLRDLTDNVDLITRQYNAASSGGGVDARFTLSTDGYFYTAWQTEQLTLGTSVGHNFSLTLLAADCQPTGHAGYVYLDGFGAVPPQVPEPTSLALMSLGLAGLGAIRRRKAA